MPAGKPSLCPHHEQQLYSCMRLLKAKRRQLLKEIDVIFEKFAATRLVDDTYTRNELAEMLGVLQSIAKGDLDAELAHSCHTHALLVAQLFGAAQSAGVELSIDEDALENMDLLSEMAAREEELATTTHVASKVADGRWHPAGGFITPTALLQQDIDRLRKELVVAHERTRKAEAAAAVGLLEKSAMESMRAETAALRTNVVSESTPSAPPGCTTPSHATPLKSPALSPRMHPRRFKTDSERSSPSLLGLPSPQPPPPRSQECMQHKTRIAELEALLEASNGQIGALAREVGALRVEREAAVGAAALAASLEKQVIALTAERDALTISAQALHRAVTAPPPPSSADKDVTKPDSAVTPPRLASVTQTNNLKKMLTTKNEQIRELRNRLRRYEPDNYGVEEEGFVNQRDAWATQSAANGIPSEKCTPDDSGGRVPVNAPASSAGKTPGDGMDNEFANSVG
eukprot:Opistho-2@68341